VPIGGPEAELGFELTGEDSIGPIDCKLLPQEGRLFHDFPRGIERGTSLVFKSNFRLTEEYVQTPYLDNRLGVYNALKVAEQLEDGVIAFTTYEEHGGGSVPFVLRYLEACFQIRNALVSDITWVTEGVQQGKGVVISLRDRNIPRKIFLDKLLQLAAESGIPYQLEVEGGGSSDGREIQMSPFPIDWCFIGAPEDYVHSPDERVHLKDVDAMIGMYSYLMKNL
ncbi:aminopeptidase, partial [Cyclobacteriaceae bacterium]|nr:aminopeptidase [Cyclobacteriaceae bacterium]